MAPVLSAGTLLAWGRAAGLLGAAGLLVQVGLVARARRLERRFGQERLTRWHRVLGPAVALVLLAHPALLLAARAAKTRAPWLDLLSAVWGWEYVPEACAGLALILAAAALSLSALRRRLSYEAWKLAHGLIYLGLALSLPHQLTLGRLFQDRPAAAALWAIGFAAGALMLAASRWLRPLRLAREHGFIVDRVERESEGVVSVWIAGRRLEAFAAQPGQFLLLSFAAPGLRWPAHPFSLSRPPDGRHLRVSIKAVGGFTRAAQGLRRGTPVTLDGPLGAFTARRAPGPRVLLVAGGIGITPLRALAEEFQSQGKDCVLVYASRDLPSAVFAGELAALERRGSLKVHHVLSQAPDWEGEKGHVDAPRLKRLVPDCAEREAFLCGPPAMVDAVRRCLQELGVAPRRIHYERFEL